MTKSISTLALAVVCAAALAAQAPAFKRTLLQQADISVAGREAVTARADIPAGVAAGRHTHPGEEVGYVLEGTVTVEINGVSKTLKAGETFLVPPNTPHNATNNGTTNAAIIATYIVEKGKPLATPVK
jgi:quercetin dioxygenase-like cupin family protein